MPIVVSYIFAFFYEYIGLSAAAAEIATDVVIFAAEAAALYGAQKLLSSINKPNQITDNQQLIKSSISPKVLIYGKVQCSGTLVYLAQTGQNNGDLYMIVAFAANRCANVLQLNLDDFMIQFDPATGNFNGEKNLNNGVVSTNYQGLGSYSFHDSNNLPHFGRRDQTVDPQVQQWVGPQWPVTSILGGIAYVGIHLIYNQNVFGGGVPNPTAIWEGQMCLDPRICANVNGTGVAGTNLLTMTTTAGMQVGNDIIGPGLPNGATIFAIHGNVLTLSDNLNVGVNNLLYLVGSVQWTNNACLLIMAYMMDRTYGFKANPGEFNMGALIASLNNCDEQILLSDGTFESRYTLNTIIDSSQTPGSNLQSLMTAMGGEIVWAGGEWYLYSGMWRPPTVTLSENDFSDSPTVPTMPSRRDVVNSCKGLFVCPQQFWQATDFPVYQVAQYIAQDQGEILWLDLQLGATTSAATAQRLAKIQVLRARVGQITLALNCKLTALAIQCGDNIYLNYARMGWVMQLFEVTGFTFSIYNGSDGKPTLGISLILRGTAPTCWDWGAGTDEPLPQGPSSLLPNPFSVPAPTNVAVISNASTVQIAPDGTIEPALQVSWISPLDAQVQGGGIIELQFRQTGTAAWIDLPDAEGYNEVYYITAVTSGIAYDVQIRSVNPLGVDSRFVQVLNTICAGNTVPPNIPAGQGLTKVGVPPHFAPNSDSFMFGTMAFWLANTNPNFSFYEVKATFFDTDADATYTWGPGGGVQNPAPTKEVYIFLYNQNAQPGFVRVRSVDTSGNRSGWIRLGDANGFATIGTGSISTQPQQQPNVSGLQVGQIGAGSIVAQQAVGPVTTVYNAVGGAQTETFSFSLAGLGFTAKPSSAIIQASDAASISAGVLAGYSYDDPANGANNMRIIISMKTAGVNVPAGGHRFSIHAIQ